MVLRSNVGLERDSELHLKKLGNHLKYYKRAVCVCYKIREPTRFEVDIFNAGTMNLIAIIYAMIVLRFYMKAKRLLILCLQNNWF